MVNEKNWIIRIIKYCDSRESITRPTKGGGRVEGSRRAAAAATQTGRDGHKGNDGTLGCGREGELKRLRQRGEIQRSFRKCYPLAICRLFAKS